MFRIFFIRLKSIAFRKKATVSLTNPEVKLLVLFLFSWSKMLILHEKNLNQQVSTQLSQKKNIFILLDCQNEHN